MRHCQPEDLFISALPAFRILRELCVDGIEADEDRCRKLLERSAVVVTALIPLLGYEKAAEVLKRAETEGKTIREVVVEWGLLPEAEFYRAISPEAVSNQDSEGGK